MSPRLKRLESISASVMAALVHSITFLLLMLGQAAPIQQSHHSILIIFGGTGDLAAKYLWKGLFDIYHSQSDFDYLLEPNGGLRHNYTFDFIASGRSKPDNGYVTLNKILTTSITCDIKDETVDSNCEKRKSEFIDKVSYFSVQTDEDFSTLCSELVTKFSRSTTGTKKELIMFMAIPPSAYDSMLIKFNQNCRAIREQNISIKLAMEKPFGLDKASAELMSKNMLIYYGEEEIYRVDHYLGKPVVRSILPFRFLNPNIEKMLNKDHIERVEIFLKETVGIDGRFDMYVTLGVLRDIHQNHLTQLLTLVTMDLPNDLNSSINIHESKERLLRQVEVVRHHNSLFGQYANFGTNVQGLEQNSTKNSPTFAACVVKINSPRWRGVPFLLVSGKQLDSRESYIRIVFKNNYVCVSRCGDNYLDEENKFSKQIVFHIGHGSLTSPSILVSKSFSPPECPDNFQKSFDTNLFTASRVHGENPKHFFVCTIMKDTPAYVSVFMGILAGRLENFVSTRQLLLSWQVWDYLVSIPKKIRTYERLDPHGHLNFIIKESVLEFVHRDEDRESSTETITISQAESAFVYMQTPATFLGHKLITSHTDHLAFLLAREIDYAADMDIQTKGSFHIAFSGGSSLQRVFQMLAQQFANLHWHSIHVWQVDERCVPHQDERSNFQMLDRELLRFVDIPYSNIHAMPVNTGGQLCDPELGGAHAYADSIRHIVPNSQFDFIVLGLGTDGHVASLFPSSAELHVDSNTFVITTEDGPPDTRLRMTLTLPLINKGKRVAVFVTGKHKRDIVNKLELGISKSLETYPILGVKPVNGTLTWYMDYNAFTGV